LSTLLVGHKYQIYTKYETLYGVKATVQGIVSYTQAQKYSYDMNVLAINEKVISTTDEESTLEDLIGTDNIYYLVATTANTDGSYSEYVVWDSILDTDKCIQLNVEYDYTVTAELSSSSTIPMTQIISDIENYIKTNYGDVLTVTIASKTTTSTTNSDGTTSDVSTLTSEIEQAELVITALNKLATTIIPAVDALANYDLTTTIDTINDDLTSIKASISSISGAIS
jgi:hypothetical protein